MDSAYRSLERLNDEAPSWHLVGVHISAPFTNRVTGVRAVDVEFHYPVLSCAVAGRPEDLANVATAARQRTETVIAHIDQALADLQSHRARLVAALETLDADLAPLLKEG